MINYLILTKNMTNIALKLKCRHNLCKNIELNCISNTNVKKKINYEKKFFYVNVFEFTNTKL